MGRREEDGLSSGDTMKIWEMALARAIAASVLPLILFVSQKRLARLLCFPRLLVIIGIGIFPTIDYDVA